MKSRNLIRSPKRQRVFTALSIAAFLLIMFQNFQPIPIERLKPDFAWAHAVSPTDGSADIRQLAPARTEPREDRMIAAPQSGSDMNSISQDWMSRQAHLITGGAEERLLADFNKKMNRMFKFEEVEGEDYPESGYDSGNDSGDDGASNQDGGEHAKATIKSGGGRKPASIANANRESDYGGFRPTSMQLTAVNRLQLSLRNRTRVSCQIQSSGLRWDISRPLSERFDLSIGHETSEAKSTLRLNYNW